jgi:hypothetical protein
MCQAFTHHALPVITSTFAAVGWKDTSLFVENGRYFVNAARKGETKWRS